MFCGCDMESLWSLVERRLKRVEYTIKEPWPGLWGINRCNVAAKTSTVGADRAKQQPAMQKLAMQSGWADSTREIKALCPNIGTLDPQRRRKGCTWPSLRRQGQQWKKSSQALQTQIQARQTPKESHRAPREQNNIRTKIFSYEMKVWLVFQLQLNNLSLVRQSNSLSSSHPSQQTETNVSPGHSMRSPGLSLHFIGVLFMCAVVWEWPTWRQWETLVEENSGKFIG